MRVAKDSHFKSRDGWPFWLWLFLLFLTASLSIAIEAALGNKWALISFLVQVLLLLWASTSTPLKIEFDGENLEVGRARISRNFIEDISALSHTEMALIRGRDADPRCWMALRFWIPTGVKVDINDPADPTPYWLVSIKKAAALAAAINNYRE